MIAVPLLLLVAVALAPGSVDTSVQVVGGPFEFDGLGGVLLVVNQLALAFTTLAVVVCAGSLVVRFRRAHGVERQQLRWVAVAAALLVVAARAALVGLAVGPPRWSPGRSASGGRAAGGDRGRGPALSAV
jgi:uncharacterized membrane protein YdcZ (DUF606 family)